MNLITQFLNETRKPEGFLGKLLCYSMNSGHAKMADWCIDHLNENYTGQLLDIGCGGGRNAKELLLRFPQSKVTAIDYSSVSVEQTKKNLKKEIQKGQCVVYREDVSKLSLPKTRYDLVTAFETVYFWPNLVDCFKNVYAVMNPQGEFVIGNESNGLVEKDKKYEKIIEGMKIYTKEEIRDAMCEAGFVDVVIYCHESSPWICIVGKKK